MIEKQNTTTFEAWWNTQPKFRSKAELARAVGTNRVSVRHWISGVTFPRDEYCDKLFEITQLNCFSPSEREAAREEHERMIPAEVKAARSSTYRANAELFRRRALASWRKRRERQRRLVTRAELDELRRDPRKRKNVCRNCGEILQDVGPHLRPAHKLTVAEYKEKWGFLRSRNATRSESTQEKQSAAMKRIRHQPPKWTRSLLPAAQAASLRTNRRGTARLEERLKARGKRLAARPQHWKRLREGDVVTDARIAQMRLASKSVPEIGVAVGLSLAATFNRLRRMGFPPRARVFLHGEPVGWRQFHALCSDFGLAEGEAARRLRMTVGWLGREPKPKRKGESLSPALAKKVVRLRAELLADYRHKPATRDRGGRPKQLAPTERAELPAKYDALRADLKAFRRWLLENPTAPRGAAWTWLCERFRAGAMRTLQFWPQFFAWLQKDYRLDTFRRAAWVPRDVAIQFLAGDYGASENVITYILEHQQANPPES